MLTNFEEDCRCTVDFEGQPQFVKINHYKLVHLGYEQCKECNKLVSERKHLCGKRKRHEKKKYVYICEECELTFKNKLTLDNHMVEIHKSEDKIKCTLCPKYFSKAYIKAHMTKGAHKLRQSCSICGKSVAQMTIHMETIHKENSEKRFICDQCSKGFWSIGQLSNHKMNVHLKLKPYTCRLGCDQSYNDRSNRNQHEKRSHNLV